MAADDRTDCTLGGDDTAGTEEHNRRARAIGEELADTDADTEATNEANADAIELRPAHGAEAGSVELTDTGTTARVKIGDLIVFDPTDRDLGYEYVVGVVIDCDEEAQEPGERPAPLVRINGEGPGQLCVVRRAKAILR